MHCHPIHTGVKTIYAVQLLLPPDGKQKIDKNNIVNLVPVSGSYMYPGYN